MQPVTLINKIHKFVGPVPFTWLLAMITATWLTGCIHIPAQPALGHSAVYDSSRLSANCETDSARTDLNAVSENGLSPQHITLLTWNIFKQSRSNWLADFQQLSHNKDLLILQEATMDESLDTVLSDLPYHWLMTTAFYYRENATGVLTASHIPSTRHCALYANEPLIQIPKSILVSTYSLAGTDQRLLVANVHGINFSLGLDSYREQFNALGMILRHHTGPLILAGDFNSWSDDRQAILNQLSKELSLQQVEYLNHHRITVFGNPIDHVYYRGLELVQAASPHVSSSDHNPLLVTFKLSTESQQQYANNL